MKVSEITDSNDFTDMTTTEIPDGMHMLSGIGNTSFEDDWTGETIEVIVLQIDGKNYGFYVDPNDGYRSYGCMHETSVEPTTIFPPQPVIARNISEDTEDEDGYPRVYHMLKLLNEDLETILKIGTDHSDSYYPMAIFRWNPERLPINKNKKY